MFEKSSEKLIGKPITIRPSMLDQNTICNYILKHARGIQPPEALRTAWHFYWTVVEKEGMHFITDYMSKHSFEALAEAKYKPIPGIDTPDMDGDES